MIIQADLRSRSNIVTWPSLIIHNQGTSFLFALITEIASLGKGTWTKVICCSVRGRPLALGNTESGADVIPLQNEDTAVHPRETRGRGQRMVFNFIQFFWELREMYWESKYNCVVGFLFFFSNLCLENATTSAIWGIRRSKYDNLEGQRWHPDSIHTQKWAWKCCA